MKKILAVLVLLLLSAVPFLPGLRAGFVNWDDNTLVTENKDIDGIGLKNIQTVFTRTYEGVYIPLTALSFALEKTIHGLNPLFYHLDNIILHALNAVLLMFLLSALTGDWVLSFCAALLWAAHPLRVESVVWVTERKDVLFGLFYLASLLLYLNWKEKKQAILYFCSLAAFVLSGLSKGTAISLPLVLLLVDWRSKGRITGKDLFNKIPYLAAVLPLLLMGLKAQQLGQATVQGALPLWTENIFIACHNLLFYILKTIYPAGLSILYLYPGLRNGQLPVEYLVAPATVTILALAALYSLKKNKDILFWFLFFVATALPVLQLRRLLGSAVAADRYTYIPSIGIIVLLLYGLRRITARFPVKRLLPAVSLAVFLPLMLMSWQRSQIWHDDISLWTSLTRNLPDSPIPYKERAVAYAGKGDFINAASDFRKVVQLNPGSPSDLNNLASAFGYLGQPDSVVFYLSKAIDVNPGEYMYFKNRAVAYTAAGRWQEALADLDRAVILRPDNGEMIYNRAVVNYNLGNHKRALDDFVKALDAGFPVDPSVIESMRRIVKKK